MKHKLIRIIILILLVLITPYFALAQQKSFAQASLVYDSFSPGKDSIISIGVLINLKDDWHIYWKNPGDSGLPTQIDFILPIGIQISEIKFPAPKVFYAEEIVNYGYDKEVLLIADLMIPKNYPGNEISIKAKISSLICKELCRSFDTTISSNIYLDEPYKADEKISSLFIKTKKMLPVKKHNLIFSAIKSEDSVFLRIKKIASENLTITSVDFFPYQESIFKNKVRQLNRSSNDYIEVTLQLDDFRIKDPDNLNGIVVLNNDLSKVFEIDINISE